MTLPNARGVQWNPSKMDTTGAQIFIRYTGMSFTEGLSKLHPSNYWTWSLRSSANCSIWIINCIVDTSIMDIRLPQAKADLYSGHRCWKSYSSPFHDVLLFCGCGHLSVLRGLFTMSTSALGRRKVSISWSSGVSAIHNVLLSMEIWSGQSQVSVIYRGCLLLKGCPLIGVPL